MNFEFSDDQKLIQDQARQFLAEHSPLTATRGVMDGQTAYDSHLWKSIVDLGWTATAIHEQYGGLGLGSLELCVIAQELGRSLTPIPFFSTIYLAAQIIQQHGNEQQKQRLLPSIAAGETIVCLASSELAGQHLFKAKQTQYSNRRLSGKKIAVLDGVKADYAIVSATDTNKKHSLYLVNLHQADIQRTLTPSIDSSRPLSSIEFINAVAEPLGANDTASAILTEAFDRAAVFTSFEQLGGCEASMQMGINYTKQRFAFGRSVASFQAIKHIFADMYVAIELARSNAYFAAWALSVNDKKLPLAAATARVSAIDAYYFCSKENIEVHGGMGFTWEFDCHLYYKRAQLLSSIIGSSRWWREQLVSRLLDE
tara:strand:+ start:18974 stop:20080 length:1107 start_codon:yes stop_codon:yes gene_type:complete